MRDAAREPAHALEPLCGVQPGLELAPVGDVADERDVQPGHEVRARRVLDVADAAVGPGEVVLARDDVGRDEPRPGCVQPRPHLGGHEIVDAPAHDLVTRQSVEHLGGRIQIDVPALGVGDVDRVERGVEDRPQFLLLLAEHGLRTLADDGRREQARRGPQRVDLRRRPVAFLDAVVDADEAPGSALDVDRHRQQRHDALRLEQRLGGRRQRADVRGIGLVPDRVLGHLVEAVVDEGDVLDGRVVVLGRQILGDPRVAVRRGQRAVVAAAELEDVRPAGTGCPAEALEQARRRGLPRRTGEQHARSTADRREDLVAAPQVDLGALAQEHGGELAPDLGEPLDLESAEPPRRCSVDRQDPEQAPGPADRHVHVRGRLAADACEDTSEPLGAGALLRQHRLAAVHQLEELGHVDAGQRRPRQRFELTVGHGLEEPHLPSVIEGDEAHADASQAAGQRLEAPPDDLVRCRACREGCEDGVDRLEPQAVAALFGDVEQVALREERSAVGVEDEPLGILHPHDAAVARDEPVLTGRRHGIAVPRLDHLEIARTVVGMDRAGGRTPGPAGRTRAGGP